MNFQTNRKCKGGGIGLPLEIDKQIVKEYLTTLNEFKSSGPDELHPRVLKKLAEELSERQSIIFSKSWETGGARGLEGGPDGGYIAQQNYK